MEWYLEIIFVIVAVFFLLRVNIAIGAIIKTEEHLRVIAEKLEGLPDNKPKESGKEGWV